MMGKNEHEDGQTSIQQGGLACLLLQSAHRPANIDQYLEAVERLVHKPTCRIQFETLTVISSKGQQSAIIRPRLRKKSCIIAEENILMRGMLKGSVDVPGKMCFIDHSCYAP